MYLSKIGLVHNVAKCIPNNSLNNNKSILGQIQDMPNKLSNIKFKPNEFVYFDLKGKSLDFYKRNLSGEVDTSIEFIINKSYYDNSIIQII